MRKRACQDDRVKEKGNLRTQEKGENGITHKGATTNGRPSKIASEETKKRNFQKDREKAMENPIKSPKIRQTCGQLKTSDFVKNI